MEDLVSESAIEFSEGYEGRVAQVELFLIRLPFRDQDLDNPFVNSLMALSFLFSLAISSGVWFF